LPCQPFALKELLARLHALTRRSNDAPKSTVPQIADLTLDTVTRRVIRAGETVDLTAEEYAVLECLMCERDVSSPASSPSMRGTSTYTTSPSVGLLDPLAAQNTDEWLSEAAGNLEIVRALQILY
jgi:hypothetical protein